MQRSGLSNNYNTKQGGLNSYGTNGFTSKTGKNKIK
jgi:hypothetical protein